MPPTAITTAKRRQIRREELVAQMLEAVESRLERGTSYAEITVEDLISSAGISRSTFYVYFQDKGAVVIALAENIVEQLIGAAQQWWQLPPGSTKADLGRALGGIIDVYRSHARIWDALVDTAAYDPSVRAAVHEIVGAAQQGVADHIRDGQRSGWVRLDLDADRVAAWLTWMTERGHYQLLSGVDDAEAELFCRAQTDIVWYTLYDSG